MQDSSARHAASIKAILRAANHFDTLRLPRPHADLLGEQRDALDDRHAHAPLPVLRELGDRGQQRVRELLDADDSGRLVQRRDEVEPYLREVVLQQL